MTIREIAERVGLSKTTISKDRVNGLFDIADTNSVEQYINTRTRKQGGRPLKEVKHDKR